MIFDAFIKSSTGSKVLHGAISAIGVVVNKVRAVFDFFKDGIINAVSHPVESIKALGKMIEQNIINRFTAFGTILDGIIHLDFKKVADGAIQAFTGVTGATDKIGKAVKDVTDEITQTGTEIAKAYKYGFSGAGEAMENFKGKAKKFKTKQKPSVNHGNRPDKDTDGTSTDIPKSAPNDPTLSDSDNEALSTKVISDAQKTSDALKQIETERLNQTIAKKDADRIEQAVKDKQSAQQLKDFELQMAQQVSSAAFSILSNSIKQQSDAKIAALQKDQTAELSNSSLTGAQKIAIEQKYKDQENQIKAKAFKEDQEASIAQAVINGALAITKGTAQTGVLAELYIPTIIAETAIEIAKIASQKPPAYAAGGLHYMSDGRGGLLPGYSRTDNTNAHLRSGEGIVVSEAMRDPWARNLVSAINVGFGGRDFSTGSTGRGFAVGGIFTDGGDANRYYNQPVNNQKNLANTIAYQMVNNFPPVYVDVKDINTQQNILAQTINRVNL